MGSDETCNELVEACALQCCSGRVGCGYIVVASFSLLPSLLLFHLVWLWRPRRADMVRDEGPGRRDPCVPRGGMVSASWRLEKALKVTAGDEASMRWSSRCRCEAASDLTGPGSPHQLAPPLSLLRCKAIRSPHPVVSSSVYTRISRKMRTNIQDRPRQWSSAQLANNKWIVTVT